jgi:hypothetical protein
MVLMTSQFLTFVKVVRRQELLAATNLDSDGREHENKASKQNQMVSGLFELYDTTDRVR